MEPQFMLTQHEAQLYFAEQLPDKIVYVPFNMEGDIEQEPYFYWKDNTLQNEILETEWQQIALWIEEKMTDEQFDSYYRKLAGYFGVVRLIILAPYITRATAMKESGL